MAMEPELDNRHLDLFAETLSSSVAGTALRSADGVLTTIGEDFSLSKQHKQQHFYYYCHNKNFL